MNEDKLLEVLNKVWSLMGEVKYQDFNKFIKAKDQQAFLDLEKLHDEVGVAEHDGSWGISTLSLIATITDLLTGKRLAFIWEEDTDLLIGFKWYQA